jgi:hypothetical protein
VGEIYPTELAKPERKENKKKLLSLQKRGNQCHGKMIFCLLFYNNERNTVFNGHANSSVKKRYFCGK